MVNRKKRRKKQVACKEAKLANLIKLKIKKRIFNVVIGDKGLGKTTETKKLIKRYIKKYPKERVLILDPFDEYTEYRKITTDKVGSFRKPSRIVAMTLSKESVDIINSFKNGLLIIEGAELYLHIWNYFNIRSRGVDLILSFQSINSIPFQYLCGISSIRIHKYDFDRVSPRSKARFLGWFPYAKVASDSVFFSSGKFNHCYYDCVNNKIRGGKNLNVSYACYLFFEPQMTALERSLTS